MPTNSPLFPPITSAFNARSTALEVVKGISLDGKNAVVTGGASGLGLETSRALVSAGANVTLAVRNLYQGKTAVSELQSTYPNASVKVMHLDLADLATVSKFAADWNGTGAQLDIFKTPPQGASTSTWAATAPQLKGRGGMYLEDCNQGLPADPANRASGYSRHNANPELALKLWDVSEKLIKTH